MKKIYFVVRSLYLKAGGLTKSVYDRASILSELYDVTIIVLSHNIDLEKAYKELVFQGKLSVNVKIITPYIGLRESSEMTGYQKNTELQCLEAAKTARNNKGMKENIYRYFTREGLYGSYTRFHIDGNIHFIDYMDEYDYLELNKRYVFFNDKPLLLQVYKAGEKRQEVVYNKEYNPVINVWYKLGGEIDRIYDLRFEDLKNTNYVDLVNQWLKTYISKEGIVFFDCYYEDNIKLFNGVECQKIAFIHNHHDYCKDSAYFLNQNSFDEYIFITKQQRQDFLEINSDVFFNSTFLPHPYFYQKNDLKRKNRIVTISRLSTQKYIDQGIRAFAKIRDAYPDIIYEIYGVGSEYDNLKALITELDLERVCLLKGYTDDALDIFSQSLLSLALTKYEGFGLSILESLSMSCPVITSNVKYGPSELIKNGENGYLIDNNDVSSIVEALKSILENSSKFHKNCLKTISHYAYPKWKEKLYSIVRDGV